jgi:hypothetical protein
VINGLPLAPALPSGRKRVLTPKMQRTLEKGRLALLAFDPGRGPLVTPVLYGVSAHHLWFLVRGNTAKGRALAARPQVGVVVGDPARSVVIRGRATLLSPTSLTPSTSLLSVLLDVPWGAASWASRNPSQLVGFVRDAESALRASSPKEFTLVSVRPRAALLVADGEVVQERGEWPAEPRYDGTTPHPSGVPALAGVVPDGLEELPATATSGVLGILARKGPLAVPAGWDPASGHVILPPGVLPPATPGDGGLPACLAFHDAVRARPTDQRGVVLRGHLHPDPGPDGGGWRLATERVTFWDGFRTGTQAV